MKKLIFILLLINVLELKPYAVNGQYVMIPDTNFINVLVNNGYSACVVGNQLDTTCNQVLTANSLNINSANLHDLTGIQYFKNLQYLEVEENAL